MHRLIVPALVLGFALLAGAAGAAEKLTIAVIPKGTTHEFWKTVHAGAVKAQQDLATQGVEVDLIWKGPLLENDRASQIDVVQTFVGQGVSGIVLAPLDHKALVAPVKLAVSQKIPVVIIDSALSSDLPSSFIATDNRAGGRLGGKRLAEVLGGKGKVILLRYLEGSASTTEREAGALEALKGFPGIELVSVDQRGGATRETALTASQNLLNRHKDVDGVFTPNDPTTAGMAQALKDLGLAGRVKHVGFDGSEGLVRALDEGRISGLVVQDPFAMGELGVKNCVAAIQGKAVARQIDTPLVLVTPDNRKDPAVIDTLNPPLAKYLK